jgi:DNA-binding NarL/FixJ family response regulator
MPGESGHELVRWIRGEHPDVAVLMATGTNDPGIADKVIAAGAYGYLLKPFKRNELSINVANAFAAGGSRSRTGSTASGWKTWWLSGRPSSGWPSTASRRPSSRARAAR